MQCPETPQNEKHRTYPSPVSSIRDSNVRKRRSRQISTSSIRGSGRDIPQHSSPSISSTCIESPYNKAEVRQSQGSFRRHRSRLSNQFLVQDAADDVFQSPAHESRKRSSAAAIQFHDAAKRLALSNVSPNTQTKLKTPTQHILHGQRLSTLSQKGHQAPQRQLPSPGTPSQSNPLNERDITSAHRLNPTSQDENSSCTIHTPVTVRKYYLNETRGPARFRDTTFFAPSDVHQVSTRRAHNFSRPSRPREAQNTPSQSHGASVRNKDLVDTSIAKRDEGPISEHHTTTQQVENSDRHERLRGNPNSEPEVAAPQDPQVHDQHRVSEEEIRTSFDSAVSENLGDKRLQLKHWEIWLQRIVFGLFVLTMNTGVGLAYLGANKHPYLLPVLVFMKSKDILSTLADILGLALAFLHRLIWPPKESKSHWILSLVCAYAETEEQIMKTVNSLARNKTRPHKQVICIILDGKPKNVLEHMSNIKITTQRPYTTWRGIRGEIEVHAGFIEDMPVVLVKKIKNAGKKDSLILGHDLFNHPREDMPKATKLLRQEIWQNVLPAVITEDELKSFGYVFCTDADSTIHENALYRLATALGREVNAIAACGVLFAEFADTWAEFSPWHLFQQFQYTFGQYVRRQAESTWGRVTCLPGCITMIVVRPEMGAAISQYARPVTEHNLFRHQVQYLGTDRRLTWCMTSQNKHLRTIFVPDALSETVVPNSLNHYLSQRRRWASNAYFNDYFYACGPQQRLITRLFASIDIVRLSLVYYRVFNTVYFLHGLITHFYVVKIIPTLVVTKAPAFWYLVFVMAKEPLLRKRLHKIFLGMLINQLISPILSIIVFSNVLLHIGSQAWGKTGASTQGVSAANPEAVVQHEKPAHAWTPRSLAKTVKIAIRGVTPKAKSKKAACTPLGLPQKEKAQSSTESPMSTARDMPQEHSSPRSPSASLERPSALPSGSQVQTVTMAESPSFLPSTPLSLLRRTPHHRKTRLSMLEPVLETPTKAPTQVPAFDFAFQDSPAKSKDT